jgi:hypothetical protein
VTSFKLCVLTSIFLSSSVFPLALIAQEEYAREYVRLGGRVVAIETSLSFGVVPKNITIPNTPAGSGTFAVTANGPWTALTQTPAWLTVTGGASGTGNGAVTYSTTVNTGTERSGTITVTQTSSNRSVTFTVTQAAPVVLTPASDLLETYPGAAGSFSVSSPPSGWTAASDSSWLVVNTTTTTSVSYTVQGYSPTLCVVRSGIISIRSASSAVLGQFQVTQYPPPCIVAPSATLAPNQTQVFTVLGGTGWTATSSAPWLSVASVNNSALQGSLTVQTSTEVPSPERSASIQLAAGTPAFNPTSVSSALVITETAVASCATASVSVAGSPISVANSPNQVGTFTVNAAGGGWVASTLPNWVSLSPSSGSAGQTSVKYTVFPNSTGSSRSATIPFSSTCTGGAQPQGFLSIQQGQATLSLSPMAVTLTGGGIYQFFAIVNGNVDNNSVTWSASQGTVSTVGFFQAPSIYSTTTVYLTATLPGSSIAVTATITVSPNPATLVASNDFVTPSSGTGGTQTFTAQASDSAGSGGITSMFVFFTSSTLSSTDATNSCFIQLSPQVGSASLYPDNPYNYTPVQSGFRSPTVLENSQCSADMANSIIGTYSGNSVRSSLALAFKTPFQGDHDVYLQTRNQYGTNTNQRMGTWRVNTTTGIAPKIVALSPNLGSGQYSTFRVTATDANGTSDLSAVELLVGAQLNVVGSCYMRYERALNRFFLRNDTGDVWIGPAAAQTTATLSNSQCTVSLPNSQAVSVGTTLDVTFTVSFRNADANGNPAFTGSKSLWTIASDNSSLISGWSVMGGWTIPLPGLPPTANSLSPTSGGAFAQTFTAQYSDPNGAMDLWAVHLLVNTAITGANGCYLYYDRPTNGLYLMNDTGNWTGPLTPGGTGSLYNGSCSLNAASSSVSIAGNTMTLQAALTFRPAFAGNKNVYIYAADLENMASGWQTAGTWNVPVSSGPAALAWWTADGVAIDAMGIADGTPTNITYGPGRSVQAFVFNGTNSKVQVGGSTMISGARTISAWIFPHATTASDTGLPIMTGGVSGAGDFFAVQGNTTYATQYQLKLEHWGTPTYHSSGTVTPETWNHVAITFDGSTLKFYINGQPSGSVAAGLYNYSVSTLLIGGAAIGGSVTNNSFNGSIDEVKLFNRALTDSEVAGLFDGPSVTAWWQGEGNSLDATRNAPATATNITYGPGRLGQAFVFNGVNSSVVMTGSVSGSGARTVSAWVYPHVNTGLDLPVWRSGTSGAADFFSITGTAAQCPQYRLALDHWGTATACSIGTVTPETWNHIAVTYNGSNVQFYINGTPSGVLYSGVSSSTPVAYPMFSPYNMGTFTIGTNGFGEGLTKASFNGLIDEVKFFNRALTDAEVGGLYH